MGAAAAVFGLVVACGAQAHPLHESGGWNAGFAHPFLGWDHALAMIAVGLWAAQLGGRALWALPATFVSIMAGGALLALSGVALPHVESGIAASVLALGLLVAFAARLPVGVGAALVAGFALFHGHSHGTELPATVSGWTFGTGFVAATALLHVAGIGIGRWVDVRAVRIAGGCLALFGLSLLTGA
jgi:urease accessory protein